VARTQQANVSSTLDGARANKGFPHYTSLSGETNDHETLSFHLSQAIPFKSYPATQNGVIAPLSAAQTKTALTVQ